MDKVAEIVREYIAGVLDHGLVVRGAGGAPEGLIQKFLRCGNGWKLLEH